MAGQEEGMEQLQSEAGVNWKALLISGSAV